MAIEWALMGLADDWGLPSVRLPYNAYTGMGLRQLPTNKKVLLNFICGQPGKRGTTMLFTSRKALQSALKVVLDYAKDNDIDLAIILENEALNERRIANTSPDLYISNLAWAKDVCDASGVEVIESGTMMPDLSGIYKQSLPRKEGNDFANYMRTNGFPVSGKQDVTGALQVIDYCSKNGITNNFHWQQESQYAPDVFQNVLPAHGDKWIAGENGVRKDDTDSMIDFVAAIKGSIVSRAVLDTVTGAQGMLVSPTEEQKQAFLQMM